jgi:hypothetical protein
LLCSREPTPLAIRGPLMEPAPAADDYEITRVRSIFQGLAYFTDAEKDGDGMKTEEELL